MDMTRRTLLKIPLALAGAWLTCSISSPPKVQSYGPHQFRVQRTTITNLDDATLGQEIIITGTDVWLNLNGNSFKLKTPITLKRLNGEWAIIETQERRIS